MEFSGWIEPAKEAGKFAIKFAFKLCFVANIRTPVHSDAL